MSEKSDSIKLVLTAITLVVGSASLPISGGASATVIIGALMAIWGIDWDA